MLRIETRLDPAELQAAVSALEAVGSFPSRSALWQALAQTDWARQWGLSAGALQRRASRLPIVIRTPDARKTSREPSATSNLANSTGKGHLAKFPRTPLPVLRADVPARFHRLVDRVENGSLRAALDLKCLECSAWQPVEVRLCPIEACPLHHRRPYQP
jgi:hypothetical protein